MAKGEITRLKKERSARNNREALAGRMALAQTYEQLKMDIPIELMQQIYKLRARLKVRNDPNADEVLKYE